MSGPVLQVSDFAAYPAQARALAVAQVDLLRQMPEALLASVLREVRGYDLQFPREQEQVQIQLAYLRSLSETQRSLVFAPFLAIDSPIEQAPAAIAADPDGFIERYTAALWASGKLDAFRDAAQQFVQGLAARNQPRPLPLPRLTIVAIGQGATATDYPLFRKLRPFGTWFSTVRDEDGAQVLMEILAARAQAHPQPYAHWYIDGGASWPVSPQSDSLIAQMSYPALAPMRRQTLSYMDEAVCEGWGPERLRDGLTHLDLTQPDKPTAIGDPRMQAFARSVFTQGSGTQIFSTTFVQWTAREALRRAEPLTTICRYAPRQRQRPLNDMFNPAAAPAALDADGALIDADMGAWYTFLEMRKLPEAERALFLAWCESRHEAIVIGPEIAKNQHSTPPVELRAILRMPGQAVYPASATATEGLSSK